MAALALMSSAAQAAELVTNGDFETGDFSGWTFYTTVNGAVGHAPAPQVSSFDTTGGGASNAAELQVGEVAFNNVYAGGGFFQNIVTVAGLLSFSADIASIGGTNGSNATGGLFAVLLNGVVLDTFDMGSINSFPTVERGTLNFSVNVGAGVQVLSLQATRHYTNGAAYLETPLQYFDNISASQGGAVVPEPATWALMITGFGLAGAGLRRQGLANRA